jgi:hypothetical protein
MTFPIDPRIKSGEAGGWHCARTSGGENHRHGAPQAGARHAGEAVRRGAIETIVGDLNDARFVNDLVNRAVTSISWSTTPAS